MTIKEIKNKYYIGEKENSIQYEEENQKLNDKELQELKLRIKDYLELDNVSFLVGAGSSYHLGGTTIGDFPKEIEETFTGELKKKFEKLIQPLQKNNDIKEIKRNDKGNINIPYESVLNYLLAIKFIQDQRNTSKCKHIDTLIESIKAELFNLCDLDRQKIRTDKEDRQLIENKYIYHEKFLKKLLQRSVNLKRANLFTTNYDLAFEYAFDNLGVHYISGFSGFHKRIFKPETFEHDIYFPGSTTTGKVHRTEKVIRYFKLHGSISWVQTKCDANNIYGIQELPINLIRKDKDYYKDLIIYPSSVKKTFTLDLPYSELFRQFAATIMQQQSVLFTLGYSFNDEHINDLIYQALSIPSFTLIVIDLYGIQNPKLKD